MSPQALKPRHLPRRHTPVPQALGNLMVLLALVMCVMVVLAVMGSDGSYGTCCG